MLKTQIISGIDADFVAISETHLKGTEVIDIPGYVCITNNRALRNVRAKRNSGGVCLLIKSGVYRSYTCDVVDKNHDGVLAIKFTRNDDNYCFIIVAMYLPPEQTSWGRNASEFYAHILKIVYEHSQCDDILLAGDVNSKIGELTDFVPEVDSNITARKILDKTTNRHGKEFIEFLIEAKLCVCNGRITPSHNNYTFIHSRGKSIIDYIVVPLDSISKCLEFQVCTSREFINRFCNISDANTDLSKMIPDHSALIFKFATRSDYTCENLLSSQPSLNASSQSVDRQNDSHNDIYYKRFNVQHLPESFFNNESFSCKMVELISRIEQIQNEQAEIDHVYEKFCNLYHDEMNAWLRCRNVHPRARKRYKSRSKPYWSENLSYLWELLCQAENAYVNCHNQQRRLLRESFIASQRNFDRNYRKAKRKYMKEKMLEIENFSKYNPKEFWDSIKKLGPKRKQDIPMSVYDTQGNVVSEHNFVMNTWAKDYESLYNFTLQQGQFDDNFYEFCNENVPENADYLHQLDESFTVEEVKKVINNSKKNKSVGLDNLPYEVFKGNSSFNILALLFNKIYEYNLVPSLWHMSVVKPIPKNSLTDPFIPLQYRGISLLSTVYKLFTSILNNRIQSTAEEHNLFNDSQNGFRKKRSCEDHLFSLTSIIRNRKRDKLDTFVTFVDFEKAFDRVDRKLLFHKLQSLGFGGKILSILKSLYSNCNVCVNVNGFLSPSFTSKFGVKQGDSLSPTLFNLFINDLADTLNASSNGVKLNDDIQISSLLYADDLAIISDSEENMQHLLNILDLWCKKWRMLVNVGKTKTVHFRSAARPRSNFPFTLNNHSVECVDRYKYLGIVLDEHLLFNVTASVLANSGSRALASIYTKFDKLKGLGFQTYSKLYQTGVAPILDYCSGVWGFQKFGYLDAVQNKAIRFYLGVHRFAPNLAINGDTGWTSTTVRRRVEMIRFWNRVVDMDAVRLTKRVFLWDYQNRRSKGSWSSDIFKLFSQIGKLDCFANLCKIDINEARNLLVEQEKSEWLTNIQSVSKLSNYRKFKLEYGAESYIYKIHNRAHRSIFAQLRCGILPLKIETGRYSQIPLEYRVCIFCNINAVEDEIHFLFDCPLYSAIREKFWSNFTDFYPDFVGRTNEEKMSLLMSENLVKKAGEYVYECYSRRNKYLYENV